MIYLASPYSHEAEWMREMRYQLVTRAAARLIEMGEVVFCPITHSHPLDTVGGLRKHGWDFWQSQDIPFLERCDQMMVLMLPGWKDSEGVSAEIAWWNANKKTHVRYVAPEDLIDLGGENVSRR